MNGARRAPINAKLGESIFHFCRIPRQTNPPLRGAVEPTIHQHMELLGVTGANAGIIAALRITALAQYYRAARAYHFVLQILFYVGTQTPSRYQLATNDLEVAFRRFLHSISAPSASTSI